MPPAAWPGRGGRLHTYLQGQGMHPGCQELVAQQVGSRKAVFTALLGKRCTPTEVFSRSFSGKSHALICYAFEEKPLAVSWRSIPQGAPVPLACLFSILPTALMPRRPSFPSHPIAHTESRTGPLLSSPLQQHLVVTVCRSLKHSRVETDQRPDTSSGLWGRLQLADSQHSLASDC